MAFVSGFNVDSVDCLIFVRLGVMRVGVWSGEGRGGAGRGWGAGMKGFDLAAVTPDL